MIKINLLPARPRKAIAIELPALPWFGILFGIVYLVVFGGGLYWYRGLAQEASQLAAEKAQLEAELKTLEAAIAKGKAFREKAQELEKRLAAIELIAKNQARPVYLLDALADMIPRDLWLTGFEEKQNQLRLLGSAYSPTALADLMSNLRGSGQFKDVDLVLSRRDPAKSPPVVTFEVVCSFGL
ncbi:MAG: PilN domain-containing protein [Candidatus Rokubacteria bacterium]|nr:PilN domain-containing protein [Candidatus Rokubacteria bacterium]